MLESPFAFLRGSAAVMAADTAPAPVTSLMVQACGHTHVSNFGVYASAEARRRGEKVIAKAKQRTNTQVIEKLADLVDGQHRIVEQRPFIVRETHTAHGRPVVEALDDFLQSYLESLGRDRRSLLESYRIVDVAR